LRCRSIYLHCPRETEASADVHRTLWMTLKATLVAAFPEARRISNFLERDLADQGVAVSLDERPDGLWSVDAYFETGMPSDLASAIRDRLGADGFGALLAVEELAEADWVAVSQEALKPVSAGRFLIHGGHDRTRLPAGRIRIEIDAAQAFGTGHHPTTAGCLIAIDQLTRRRQLHNPLDLGTGSGVLAIAIAKLLRIPVLATDVDPVAIAIAAGNASANGVAHFVRTKVGGGPAHPAIRQRAPFDLVVANIHAGPLIRMAPQVARILASGATLVLSGLLRHQSAPVVAAYTAQRIWLQSVRTIDGGSVLVLRRA